MLHHTNLIDPMQPRLLVTVIMLAVLFWILAGFLVSRLCC